MLKYLASGFFILGIVMPQLASATDPDRLPYQFVSGSVSPTLVQTNGSYTVKCNYGAKKLKAQLDAYFGGAGNDTLVGSIQAITNSGSCNLDNFTNDTATFNCTAGSTPGSFNVSCKLNQDLQQLDWVVGRTDFISTLDVVATPTPSCTPVTPNNVKVTPATIVPGGFFKMTCDYGVDLANISVMNANCTVLSNVNREFACRSYTSQGNYPIGCTVLPYLAANACPRRDVAKKFINLPSPSPSPTPSHRTFYIDYDEGDDQEHDGLSTSTPWKHAPGMSADGEDNSDKFSGDYTAQLGDTFVFKGGVTWPASSLPLKIENGTGREALPYVYRADENWHTGSIFTRPIFDGATYDDDEITVIARKWNVITAENQFHFVIERIHVKNAENAAVEVATGSRYKITDMILEPYGLYGILIGNYAFSPGPNQPQGEITIFFPSEVEIARNDISHAKGGVWATNYFDGLDIHHNTFHDFTDQIKLNAHGDAVHIFGPNPGGLPAGVPNPEVKNLKIHDNLFYGDFYRNPEDSSLAQMTAMIFVEDNTEGALVYNNVMSYAHNPSGNDAGQFEAMIKFTGDPEVRDSNGNLVIPARGGYHHVFNNTIWGTNPGMSGGLMIGDTVNGSPYTEVKNNILYGMRYAYSITGVGPSGTCPFDQINYTCWTVNPASNSTFISNNIVLAQSAAMANGVEKSWVNWQLLGFDSVASSSTDPLFVDASASPPNLHLTSTSPARSGGVNFYSLFQEDLDGFARPVGSQPPLNWSIGGYEYQ